jgi:hypothetical protein
VSIVKLRRELKWLPVSIGTATSSSSSIRTTDAAGMAVEIAERETAATRVAVFASHDDTSYRSLYGADGAAAEIVLGTATSGVHALPEAAFACSFVRLVADAELGTAAVCRVSFKS